MPYFINAHASVQATGLAYNPENKTAYYASCAGPKTAVKSVWAALVRSQTSYPTLRCSPWTFDTFSGDVEHGVQQLWQNVPNTAWAHAAFVSKWPALILLTDPEGGLYTDLGDYDQMNAHADLARKHMRNGAHLEKFYWYLNKTIDVPLKREWADALWHQAETTSSTAIKPLDCFGEVIAAYLVDPNWDWLNAVQTLLMREAIAI